MSTRQFSLPAPLRPSDRKFDKRYGPHETSWWLEYKLNGEIIVETITCGDDESPKLYLANLGVDIMEATVKPIW